MFDLRHPLRHSTKVIPRSRRSVDTTYGLRRVVKYWMAAVPRAYTSWRTSVDRPWLGQDETAVAWWWYKEQPYNINNTVNSSNSSVRSVYLCFYLLFMTLHTISWWITSVKPDTHWRQTWIQQSRFCWKSTKSTVSPRTHWQHSWTYTATVDFVADLLAVSATVDFQQSRGCWIQLCRQCVPDFTRTVLSNNENEFSVYSRRRPAWTRQRRNQNIYFGEA